MALNKFMHPRNIYKTPPDFAKLAKEYKEFSEIAVVDVSGKFTIDFKNANSLRVLTKCLLKSDFDVEIEIPSDRLVPTLPLRLNYILWIEDLLHAIQKNDTVIGLDIGTGASAIYPILSAVKNKWQMVGTESDEDSFIIAKNNVEKNNLQHLIKLRRNETSSVLDFILQDENIEQFSFCMCNPPFYSTFQDLWESRSPARPPPKNGFTGSPQELITEGGELQFCRKIIDESRNHKEKILIFTTMVGHKFNLKELVLDMKANGIKYTTTEFCQGRVTRWGLAWTFLSFEIDKLVPSRDKPRKKNLPIIFTLPKLKDKLNNTEKFEAILQNLEIGYSIINRRKSDLTLDIVARTNTWSNQRRKRRLTRRIEEDEIKKIKLNTNEVQATVSNSDVDDTGPTKEIISVISKSDNVNKLNADPIVHAVVNIRSKDDTISVEMEYLEGSAGKEGIHQIIQFIKNNWK